MGNFDGRNGPAHDTPTHIRWSIIYSKQLSRRNCGCRLGCTRWLAPSCEYDWTTRVWPQCGLVKLLWPLVL